MSTTWITPVDVTPSTTGSWVDVDVSSYVSNNATGVLLILLNGGNNFNVRNNGSSDNRIYKETSTDGGRNSLIVGVDSSKIFEAEVDTGATLYLVGYFESEAVFFTNAVDVSLGSYGLWKDIDISTYTSPNTAIAAFLEIKNGSVSARNFGLRKNGSTDNRKYDISSFYYTRSSGVVGVDFQEIFEGYIESTYVDFFLTGYYVDGATFHTNAIDVTPTTYGSYVDLTTLNSSATGGFYECGYGSTIRYSLRGNGKTYDYYGDVPGHAWSFSEAVNNVVEGKIEGSNLKIYEVGYSYSLGGTGWSGNLLGVTNSNIGKIDGVNLSNISKVDGV